MPRVPRKSDVRLYEVLHLSHKIILANLQTDASKMQPFQEISALTSWHLWWPCLLYCACRAICIFADLLPMSRTCYCFGKCHDVVTFCSRLTRCRIPRACHVKRHLNLQKCSVPVSFLHFGLSNVLRATTARTFRHLNFQKRSDTENPYLEVAGRATVNLPGVSLQY